MISKGIPHIVTYNSVINGACRLGELGKARDLLGNTRPAIDLVQKVEQATSQPDMVMYNIVIDSLCKECMLDDAFKLFSHSTKRGIRPNIVTYNSLIQGACDFSQ
ncbi:Pentatricopeptide repeat [Dillenia turbinata]|uniref:Pentatricopeptide repeat n=1 Tax=Dillenia turbinata TaxID=194707 RepID=A0AAN8UTR8_9MAGN